MKLVLHIGGGKCGSSAIQDFLGSNVAALKSNGILVPSTQLDLTVDNGGRQVWFFENLVNREGAGQVVRSHLAALHDHMQRSGLDTLVVSAENLVHSLGLHDLFDSAQELFDVRIIAYVRRQDDYFASAWQQWNLKRYASLQACLDDRLGKDANWAEMLAPWEERFGRGRIAVRRFQSSALLNGDIVEDFLSVTGLQHAGCVRLAIPSNVRFDENLGVLAHRVRDVFSSEHDNEFFLDLFSLIGPKALKTYGGSILFTLEERQRILAAYDECNRLLRQKYFSDLTPDEPLFELPDANDVVTLTELERFRCEQDLLVRAIAGLAKKVRALEKK